MKLMPSDEFYSQPFTTEIKKFAITLHTYSPKAYRFIRDTFSKVLPHEKTIYRWMTKLVIEPGFSRFSLNLMESIVKSENDAGKQVYCSLVLDEMKIKKNVWFNGRVFTGYVDLGEGCDASDENEIATEALVFMVNCLNGHWKFPVAFFFINKLNANGKYLRIYFILPHENLDYQLRIKNLNIDIL